MGLGEKDAVLPTGLCLALIYGAFFLNADVAMRTRNKAKSQANIWDWATTSDAHQAVFLSSTTLGNNQFPNNVVCTLKDFSALLAGQGIVDPHVERHKVLT